MHEVDVDIATLLRVATGAARRVGVDQFDAEDAASLALVDYLSTGDEIEQPRAWISCVARRKALGMQRREAIRRKRVPDLKLVAEGSPSRGTPLEGLLDLKAALHALEGTKKEQVFRSYLEGQNIGAIAKATGLSLSTIRRRLKKERETLQRVMTGRSMRSSLSRKKARLSECTPQVVPAHP